MNFLEIARERQSCRAYDETKPVESEKLEAILEAARIAPTACNGQPYHITVCRGQASQEVALACRGLGMNKFATQAPITLVVSEMPYVKSAAMGAKVRATTTGPLTSALSPPTSPPRPPHRACPPASWAGWTIPKSGRSVI